MSRYVEGLLGEIILSGEVKLSRAKGFISPSFSSGSDGQQLGSFTALGPGKYSHYGDGDFYAWKTSTVSTEKAKHQLSPSRKITLTSFKRHVEVIIYSFIKLFKYDINIW